VPIGELKSISDRYAIDVVDTVHKVCSRHLSPEAGGVLVARARKASQESWQAVTPGSASANDALLRASERLLEKADHAAERAQELMFRADLEGLESFRSKEMYGEIEPLTASLQALIFTEMERSDALMADTVSRLSAFRSSAAIALSVVCVLSLLLALWLPRRFAASLSKIEGVVRRVAAGDFTQKVRLGGSDELAHMAEHIDQMIASLADSRHELEQHAFSLTETADQAQAANMAKSLFLSTMSHELRTPLNVILGYTQLMAREAGRSDSDRDALARVLTASRHLLQLIEDVLSISKIEAGKVELRPRAMSPAGLLQSIEQMFAARAQSKGLELDILADPALPEAVEADEGKLRQVLVNLVSNAIKFTEKGQVELSLWAEGDKLHGRVSDTGAGISEADQRRLFQTFAQGHAGHGAGEGTGLGLYISSSLVRHMSGELTVSSQIGRGSEFRFFVEAPPCDGPELPTQSSAIWRLPQSAKVNPMLVVDDRDTNRELLRRALEDMGFEVEEAEDGEAAVETCAKRRHSLVWMDLRMPKMDGHDARRIIHERDELDGQSPRRIVAITASVMDFDRAEARAQGFFDLVNKPFRLEEIAATVSAALELVLDEVQISQARNEPASLLDTSEVERELGRLPSSARAKLLDSLVLGDVGGATSLLKDGDVLNALSKDVLQRLRNTIESFQHDSLISVLRSQPQRPEESSTHLAP
jgi:signal transduction histidine kinase/CheY-like chemotaxis protein